MNDSHFPVLRDLAGIKIVLGICGSVAVYKAAYLVRELCSLGASVRVVMTQGALSFMQPMTFQALSGEEVRCDLLHEEAERAMGHIELARWADYLLVAPASANFIAKMAHGVADDLLSTLYLASTAPVIICPAMNKNMWAHPATMANCAVLSERGAVFCGPEEGSQACGDMGLGRMVEPETIVSLLRLYPVRQLLHGREVLITAGATREPIDPVRYLSNHSSGKMGYALAQAAQVAGANVTLISGPCALKSPFGVQRISVDSARDMLEAVDTHLQSGAVFIGAAAVADYRLADPKTKKIKRQAHATMSLSLQKNPDILAAVVARKCAALVVGFAAETHDVLAHAAEKLCVKQVDMMIANQVGRGLGFESEENQVTVLTPNQIIPLALAPKITIAGQIIVLIAQALKNPIRSSYEPIYSS